MSTLPKPFGGAVGAGSSESWKYVEFARAVSQRDGDAKTPYARIQNLGRVRVVVK